MFFNYKNNFFYRLRRGKNNSDKARVRNFVEGIYGRGSSSSRLTTNPRRVNKHKKDLFKCAGLMLQKGLSRKALVFVNKTGNISIAELEGTLLHEKLHVAVNRNWVRRNKKNSELTTELIAYLGELEYLNQHFPDEAKKWMNFPSPSKKQDINIFARNFSVFIFRVLPKEKRIQLLKDLIEHPIRKRQHLIKEIARLIKD